MPVLLTNLGLGGSLSFAKTGGGSGDTLVYNGAAGNDNFIALDAEVILSIDGQFSIASTEVTNLSLNGGPGAANILTVFASAANDFVGVEKGDTPDSGTVYMLTGAVPIRTISYNNVAFVNPTVADDANLLVSGPDLNEPNNTRGTATFLGSGSTLQIDHAAIFPNNVLLPPVPADNDFYRVVAQHTGTLDFQVFFKVYATALLPGGGNLALEVLDSAGHVVAHTAVPALFGAVGDKSDARIRIPAVAGQSYYLHVFGANADGTPNPIVVNGYDAAIVNTPAIVPANLELSRSVPAGVAGSPDTGDLPPNAPGDDSGRSQLDDVTNNSQPRIYLRLSDGIYLNDLPGNGTTDAPPTGIIPIPFSADGNAPGFRLAIFDGDNTQSPAGFASQVAGMPGLYSFTFSAALTNGVHHLTAEVQMVDPATTAETGFGGASAALDLTVDTVAPQVAFGSTAIAGSGLDGGSDSGVSGQPATMGDRITNVGTPTFYGIAEANSIVRLYVSTPAGNVLIGQTTALPSDGTNADPNGDWKLTSNIDLNDKSLGLPVDGVRTIFVTAEDLAGNISAPQSLTIFVDTHGPKVNNISITGSPAFDLFLNKPTEPSPTPLVKALDITFGDQPVRVGPFVYPAVNPALASTIGNYVLVGEHTGTVAIGSVTFADSKVTGTPGMSVATLQFAAPLADDRYTLSISDHITDNAGNPLDGEFNGATFPSGNGTPGGILVGTFTVDSRPEIGVYSSGTADIDLNANGTFDPQNADAQNRDAVISLGYPTDRLFSGQFADAAGVVNGFDKLAAYGMDSGGQWRWLLDRTGLGITGAPVVQTIPIDGLPVAGNFDGVAAHGAQVGLFDGKTWYLDVLNQGSITGADVNAPATATYPAGSMASDMAGLPIAGDFDGDGKIDLATYQNGLFEFDLSSLEASRVVSGQWNARLDTAPLLPASVGANSVLARPVAADMNADGTTDLGIYVPGRTDGSPGTAQWYFLVSDPAAVTPAARFASLNHTFQGQSLGGGDFSYQFGDQFALPLVGNFDPPSSGVPAASFTSTTVAADWISRLYVQILGREPSTGDLANWISQVNQGATADQVAQSFVDSAEHRGQVIDQLYQQYLGRHADSDGVAFWTSVWNAAGGPELVQAGIIGSPEYYATAGKLYAGLTADAAWVTALYRNILGRDVDQQGLGYWVDYIQSHSKQSVVLGFVTSDEYRLQLINGWFETYLGRALDASGAAYWWHQMQQGLGQDQIVIGILSSEEFRNRA